MPGSLAAATIYLLVQIGLGVIRPNLAWLPITTSILSIISFIQYGRDKSAAKRDKRRIPERQLQLIALLGGWPGSALAQRVFRHKTQKRSFQIAFYAAVVTNVGLVSATCYYLWSA